MKITIRKQGDVFEAYVPKKDLEEKVVALEHPTLWGGWIRLANGWTFQMPDMPQTTPLPITVDARKTGGGED